MSYKEIDVVTPTTSDLSHDDNLYHSKVSDTVVQSQLKMSVHSLSTPISSPSSSGPSDVQITTKLPEPMGAAPLSPSATSEHDILVKDMPENDSEDDDENDDLFNEPHTSDPPSPAQSLPTSQPSAEASETVEVTPVAFDAPASDSTTTAVNEIAQIKVEESTAEKRAADTLDDEPPSVKRTKTDVVIKSEAMDTSNTSTSQPHEDALDPRNPPPGSLRTLPKHQIKFALASLRSVKRLKDASPFVEPVDHVKLNIPTYYTVITNPMDLGTMERKVNEGKYTSFTEFMEDMELIVSNSVQFNGPDSFITDMARNIKASFEKHMNNMPPYELAVANANSKAKKRSLPASAKNQRAVATATPPPANIDESVSPKKPSRSSSVRATKSGNTNAKNTSKKASPGVDSQPFALHPSGVPTIRRESSVGGRPKREIHPPKSKDLPYGDIKPRRKKFAAELRFCGNVLKDIMSKKHEALNFPFLQPVDPVALNCPSYFNIIKQPMDLSTIQHKYNTNQYETAEEFESDVRLMFANCYKFNPEGSPVNNLGHQLESLFDQKWKDLPVTPSSPPPVVPMSDSEYDSDLSESEVYKENNAIKFMEAQITRMTEALEDMKREALMNARAARDQRKKAKKTKRANAAGSGKKGGRASSSGDSNYTAGRRKSSAGNGRRASPYDHISPPAPTPYVTYEMKEELSRMCQNLPEKKMRHVLKLIQEGMPNFNSEDQEEVELEIDQLNPATVFKLYDYVVRSSNNKRARADSTTTKQAIKQEKGTAAQKRKGKPLSEDEQTRQIEELQRKLAQFDQVEAAGSSETASVHQSAVGAPEVMISASGAGMASAGNAGNLDQYSSDDDSSSSEEE